MAKIERDRVLDSLLRMPRSAPAFFAAFLAGVMLLFLDELGLSAKTFMIPSLIVYAMGAAFLGFFHRLLGLHYVKADDINTEKPIPRAWKVTLFAAHLLWLTAFVIYNFWRGAL